MKKPTRKQTEEVLKKQARKVTDEDLKRVLEKQQEIEDKFKSNGPLGRFITDLKLLLSLIQDYWDGNYRAIPWWSIAAVVAALLYVLNPLDLIPDVIPIVGYLDDAAIVALCLRMVEGDLHNYRDWKTKNP